MDRIGSFLVSDKNNFTNPMPGHYKRVLPKGTIVHIIEGMNQDEKYIVRTDGIRYETIKSSMNEKKTVILHYMHTPDKKCKEYIPTPKFIVKQAELVQKVLTKILPESVQKAFKTTIVRGNWIGR